MNADAAFTETNHAEMKPMSGMAVTAFVLTLLFCIPVLPLVGLLLGLAALGRTATPGGTMRGRPLAVTAIIVGVLVTAGQVYTTVKMVEVAKIIADAFEVVVNGPEVALGAAFKGDSPEATEWWWPGSEPSAAKTAAFAADCRGRFGEFVSVVIIDDFQPPMGQTTFSLPYKFTFKNGVYDGSIQFRAVTDGATAPTNGRYVGITEITVIDTDGAKVVWSALDADLNTTTGDILKGAPDETTGKPAAEKSAEKMDDQSPPSDP